MLSLPAFLHGGQSSKLLCFTEVSLLAVLLRQKEQAQPREWERDTESKTSLLNNWAKHCAAACPSPSAAQKHTDACLLPHSRSHMSTASSSSPTQPLSPVFPLLWAYPSLFLHLYPASPTSTTTHKPAPLNMIYSSIIKGQRPRERGHMQEREEKKQQARRVNTSK